MPSSHDGFTPLRYGAFFTVEKGPGDEVLAAQQETLPLQKGAKGVIHCFLGKKVNVYSLTPPSQNLYIGRGGEQGE